MGPRSEKNARNSSFHSCITRFLFMVLRSARMVICRHMIALNWNKNYFITQDLTRSLKLPPEKNNYAEHQWNILHNIVIITYFIFFKFRILGTRKACLSWKNVSLNGVFIKVGINNLRRGPIVVVPRGGVNLTITLQPPLRSSTLVREG